MVDLTTLEGQDTPGKVTQLAAKAVCPAPTHPEVPSCAALCVYPARRSR
jgi:deoxyribose-phosphate aldolase